jgi:AmmeMemoRadiSam system protein B/AmmeMemoRadiSam system protein A
MKRKALAFHLFFILALSPLWAQGIRKPVWAGQFYSANPQELSRQIEQWLNEADYKPQYGYQLKALIVPHAGYIYSGKVAARAYKQVLGQEFDAIVIIGPSHHFGFRGCSVYQKGAYVSPLGTVHVDQVLSRELSRATGFGFIPEAHAKEHSIEVQIPFIQQTLPDTKIIPVVMGVPSKNQIDRLAKGIMDIALKSKILVIVSTDMSHYLSKEQANKKDKNTIDLIVSKDIKELENRLLNRENILCGGAGVASSLQYAMGLGKTLVDCLYYDDSSSAGGPESQVVGYMSAAVYVKKEEDEFVLSQKEKEELLTISRTAIQSYVKDRRIVCPEPQSPQLHANRGAFVTLERRGRLRGCIGFIEPIGPLYKTVAQAAVYAACRDARFPPLSPSELAGLEIEISVLTVPRKIDDISEIEVGKHGLIIAKGPREGLLLPQVATENNWSRKEFLAQTCLKAGLPKDAWKTDVDIYIFEAIVFH